MKLYSLIFILIFISVSPVVTPLIKGVLMILMSILFLSQGLKSKASINIWFKLLLISIIGFFIKDFFDFLSFGGDRFGFLLIPVSLFFGIIFYLKYNDVESFELFYADIILKLSTLSLVVYSMVIIFPAIISYFPTYTYGGFTNRTIYLFNQLTSETSFLKRNSGFASEPGLFQLFIILALYIEIKKYGFSRLVRIVILTITVLTTKSTLGILLLFVVFSLKSFKSVKYFIIICLIFISVIIGFGDLLLDQFNTKFVNSISFSERFSPFLNIVMNYKSNIMGVGSFFYSNNFERLNIGSWDSFSQIFIRYGYFPLIFLLGILLKLLRNNFFIGIILFLSFFSQNIWFMPFVIYLILLYSNNETKYKKNIIP